MVGAAVLQRRPVLLAGAALAGLAAGHALESLGRLPGVHSGSAIRAVTAVGLQLAVVAVALGAAVVVDSLLQGGPRVLRFRLRGLVQVAAGSSEVPASRIVGGVRGRGPPPRPVPRPNRPLEST